MRSAAWSVGEGAVKVTSEAHLVPETQGDDVGETTALEKVGWVVHLDFLDDVGVVVRSRQKHFSSAYPQGERSPAHSFESIGLPHGVQFSLFNEVADVICTWIACLLEEGTRSTVLVLCFRPD